MSIERRNLLQAYGAQLVLTEGAQGMTGAIRRAQELAAEYPSQLFAGAVYQSRQPRRPPGHHGPEICGGYRGGDRLLRRRGGYRWYPNRGGEIPKTAKSGDPGRRRGSRPNPRCSGPAGGGLRLQGIGAGFVPDTLDTGVYDEVICVTDADALEQGREMARREGLLVGISSGAALWAARRLAERQEYAGGAIVVLLPDTGERYLSTPMFKE